MSASFGLAAQQNTTTNWCYAYMYLLLFFNKDTQDSASHVLYILRKTKDWEKQEGRLKKNCMQRPRARGIHGEVGGRQTPWWNWCPVEVMRWGLDRWDLSLAS